MSNQSKANSMLGYPDDARLLIINADDFGFCHAINEGIMRSLQAGLVRSTTLMAPCPWVLHAMQFLDSHPEVPFGIHLTVLSDSDVYKWGPVSARKDVPSLVDRTGYFYKSAEMPGLLARARLVELEVEFRAQIEAALAFGLAPTHLDWHALRFGHRSDMIDLMVRLAKVYGLALRVIGQPVIEKLQSQGLPVIDYNFLDSFSIVPSSKPARYAQLLRALPAGLSEWAVHPGLRNSELQAIEPDGSLYRQADLDFWTSQQARAIIEAEGIILLDYRSLQPFWREK